MKKTISSLFSTPVLKVGSADPLDFFPLVEIVIRCYRSYCKYYSVIVAVVSLIFDYFIKKKAFLSFAKI